MKWAQLCSSLNILWHCLSLGSEWNLTFSVLWPLLFPKFPWLIEWSTFTASSFRVWKSSTGIPSLPIALFLVMLPKAYLTSHNRTSGCRWVITLWWLSRLLSPFLYSSSVYSCHVFLISFTSVRSIPLLSFIVPILAWNIPLVSSVLLTRSLVLPILLFSSISLHWSLRMALLSLHALLWNSALIWKYLSLCLLPFTSLLFSAICKVSSDNYFTFLHIFFFGMILVTTSCTMFQTSVHSCSSRHSVYQV